jgi:hypothetical protein
MAGLVFSAKRYHYEAASSIGGVYAEFSPYRLEKRFRDFGGYRLVGWSERCRLQVDRRKHSLTPHTDGQLTWGNKTRIADLRQSVWIRPLWEFSSARCRLGSSPHPAKPQYRHAERG